MSQPDWTRLARRTCEAWQLTASALRLLLFGSVLLLVMGNAQYSENVRFHTAVVLPTAFKLRLAKERGETIVPEQQPNSAVNCSVRPARGPSSPSSGCTAVSGDCM